MSKATTRRLGFSIVILMGLGAMVVLPELQSTAITTAFADDDDDGGADDDSDDGGSGNSRGSSDDRDGGDAMRPRDNLRSLFRWPFGSTDRAAPPRRTVSIPDRAPNEIVALGLNDVAIARLTQAGFVVAAQTPIALTGNDMVKLTVPSGMTMETARQAVVSAAPNASVDFNHFYQPEQQQTSACTESDCKLIRHIVEWPQNAVDRQTGRCASPLPIGLIDTAINANHSSLAGTSIDVLRLADHEPTSAAQHGTAVAALLVGSAGSRAPGLLPGAKLVAIDAFQRYRKTADIADIYDLIRALDLLAARNIRIINMSLSGPPNMLFEQAVGATISKGTILIAAAGNDGPNAKPVYPAAYADVIAVTAVDKNMKPYRRAVRGEHIDIAAPGVGVWTAASISGARQKSGTSFAAPFVAAAASLLLGAHPDMRPHEVADTLTRAAKDMGEPGKDPIFGWGLLNVKFLCQS